MLDLDILSVIPEDDEVKKSANLKVPVVMKRKDSPASVAQISLAKKLSGSKTLEEPDIGIASPSKVERKKFRSLFGR